MRNLGPYNEDEMNDEEKALFIVDYETPPVDEEAPQEKVSTKKDKKNANQG